MTVLQSLAQSSPPPPGSPSPPLAPAVSPPTTLSQNGFALAVTNYGHIEQQAGLSATKSALLVAAHALLGVVYVGLIKDYRVFKLFAWTLEAWLFFVAGITLLLGFLLSLYAILPKSKPEESGDVLFFASIHEFMDAKRFIDAYRAKDAVELLEDELLKNIYGKSCWLRKNFYLIRGAIYCSCFGTLLGAIAVFMMRNEIG